MEADHSKWSAQRPELLPTEFDTGGLLLADTSVPRLISRESTVTETLRVLRKRKCIILATLIIAFTLALLASLRTRPQYDATARIALGREDNGNLGFKDVQGSNDAIDYDYTVSMDTQSKILQRDRKSVV